MSSAQKKAEQIAHYYLFHKKIELIFIKGIYKFYKYHENNIFKSFFSNDDLSKKEDLYVMEKNWIDAWKIYVNYEEIKNILDTIKLDFNDENEFMKEIKERCNCMILTEQIKDDDNKFEPHIMNDGMGERNFIHKLIFNLEDFDNLVDDKTFNLFSFGFFEKPYLEISGLILDKMIILLIQKERKMKFIFKDKNKDLLELTADFNVKNGIEPTTAGIHLDNTEWRFNKYLFSTLLKKKFDEIIDVFIKEGIKNSSEIMIKVLNMDNKNFFSLKNDSLFVQNTFNINKNITKKKLKFENINKPYLIGLANIGATCYMNATLQNLINTDLLTRYLLSEKNYTYITQHSQNFE